MNTLDQELDSEFQRRISQQVRVRLLIAFPLFIVLILSIVAGILYQVVESEFAVGGPGSSGQANVQRMGEFARRWIYLIVGLNAVGALVGLAVAYSITLPVQKLIRLSHRVARGDFTERSNIERLDDFAMLGRSFDSMVDSLNRFIELRNRFILESFTGGLITLDLSGSITAMNSAAERLLGIDARSASGKSFEEVLGAPEFELLRHAIREALWEKQSLRSRKILIQTPAGEMKTLLLNATPMKELDGSLFGLIVNFRDYDEWERFHREMARTDQLAALGTFAAGLAHELRNPLGAIRGLAQLLGEEPTLPERCREYIRVIVKECERLENLVREIHDYSQPQSKPETEVDINLVVQRALTLAKCNMRTPLPEGLRFVESLGNVPPIRANAERLTQALMNILANAIEATPANGEIRVTTRLKEEPQPTLLVEIENTGAPIDAEILDKVFEPFFTTKDSGTGLGLSIAHQIVASHGGRISLANVTDGVRVSVELPLMLAAKTETRQSQVIEIEGKNEP
ncbi:MAG: ATP-binding protein [Candidatus Sumerlaeaceae bacterium]|nr:ATP-binding protein [Candidatus Sumerlaeaceae bacterium]